MARPRTLRRPSPPPATALAPPTGIRWRAADHRSRRLPRIREQPLRAIHLRRSRLDRRERADPGWWRLEPVLFPRRELPTAGGRWSISRSPSTTRWAASTSRGYHLVNIAIHLLCGLLIFGIVRRTLELPALKDRFGGAALNLGFAAALLWTLHPLNTEAVNYVTQRTELMMALFYLLTLYASIRALARGRASGTRSPCCRVPREWRARNRWSPRR